MLRVGLPSFGEVGGGRGVGEGEKVAYFFFYKIGDTCDYIFAVEPLIKDTLNILCNTTILFVTDKFLLKTTTFLKNMSSLF